MTIPHCLSTQKSAQDTWTLVVIHHCPETSSKCSFFLSTLPQICELWITNSVLFYLIYPQNFINPNLLLYNRTLIKINDAIYQIMAILLPNNNTDLCRILKGNLCRISKYSAVPTQEAERVL